MTKTQTAVVSRTDVEPRAELSLRPPADPPPSRPRREPRPAERIRDALLQWLDEEL